ncbi:MAG: S9 family peptidase [Candidatus Neomarinimicrobiota bacterium]|nr:MAG: S9 family peptidase [Candidatus Neomarinimicrobiota bacterium]
MPQPPLARKIPRDVTVHGDRRIDNYYWLRDRDNPEVIKYLEQENAYTEAMMAGTKDLQETLFQEMKSRIKETDLSVPVKKGDYYYYQRTEAGKQYPIYCRKKGSLDAPEAVLLDQNELAEGKDFFDIGAFRVSPGQDRLAYSVDETGNENFTVFIKDLVTGELFTDRITGTYYSLEWANDNQTLFYNTLDAAHRPYRVYRHRLGTDQKDDRLVYEETDERFFLEVDKSKDERLLYLVSNSEITTEIRRLDADQPDGEFEVVLPRQRGVEYSLYHHGHDLYILTNDEAVNFRLVKAPEAAPGREHWETVIAPDPNVLIQSVEAFADYLAVFVRDRGNELIRVLPFTGREPYTITFEEPVYSLGGQSNPDFQATTLRFSFSSLKTPRQILEVDLATGTRTLLKQTEVLGGYDPDRYETKRLWAPADDGTRIPLSLIYRKDIDLHQIHPTYLYGYGSYGSTIDPYFSSNRFSLIDRGFVYVIAHVRGGGFLGRTWYLDGKWLKKKHTFTDFIAAAEYLIGEGITDPDHLAIAGGSAGGLLMGAVTNMRPDLFHVVVASVPFVDVVNTMLDESIPLTVIEFDEWGNPKEKEYYDYMISYSPYDNIRAQDYPNLLITAGLNDPRVGYWEPAKFTAKLRAMKTDQNWLLLKTNMGAGHMGASGRYDYLREVAFRYAFVLDRMGIHE